MRWKALVFLEERQKLGSVIISAGLIWGFVASLVILLVHHDGEFEISLATPK